MNTTRSRHAIAFCLVALAAVVIGYGLSAAPARVRPNLLLDSFYGTSLGVAAMFFLATQRLTGARWSASLRRIPEAITAVLPIMAVLMLLFLYFGRETLFPWSRAGAFAQEPAIAGKVRYLQTLWVFARMAVVLLLWSGFALVFRRLSLQQDRRPELSLVLHHRLNRCAAAFAPVFALTFTIAVFDCLLSLDPRWFSTVFAVYVFAGTFVQGIAAVTLCATILHDGPLQNDVREAQLNDLGKMLFAFSTFWAYIWVCQYLLIWYGNIPEETTHYLSRTQGRWLYLFAANLVVNWVVPFLALISRPAKSSTDTLRVISVLLLGGHWLDLYLLIMPAVWPTPKLGLFEIAIATGFAALVYLMFVHAMGRAPLVPLNDPVLAYERLHAISHDVVGAEQ
jgi:hypothetical protein